MSGRTMSLSIRIDLCKNRTPRHPPHSHNPSSGLGPLLLAELIHRPILTQRCHRHTQSRARIPLRPLAVSPAGPPPRPSLPKVIVSPARIRYEEASASNQSRQCGHSSPLYSFHRLCRIPLPCHVGLRGTNSPDQTAISSLPQVCRDLGRLFDLARVRKGSATSVPAR